MNTSLVDFHCHLDLYPDHPGVVAECEEKKIFALSVTTTPKAWPRNRQLAGATRYVRAALGLHPQLVSERANELAIWKEHLSETRYVGEVGLDAGPRFYRSLELQKKVFAEVLRECARHGDKILSVHTTRAAKTVLDMVETLLPPPRGRVVLHWFTGSIAEARRAIDLGCYFSINAEMVANQRHHDLVARLPIDRILTETDGPFTTVGSRPRRPTDVTLVIDSLSQCLRIDSARLSTHVYDNLRRLLQDEGSHTR